ncbi:MAG: tRNA (adenosine(37)-N6)-dimethylallyltransferase MiaA, partial [Bacteroidota bacterium]
ELAEMLATYKSLHNTTDIDTKKRAIRAIEIAEFYARHPEDDAAFPTFDPLFIGVKYTLENRRKRITERLHQRLDKGMIEEVERLLEQGLSYEDLEYYGLEYKYISLYLKGDTDKETMIEKLNIAIHQFAKRQMTWFRKMEREGSDIHWIAGELDFDIKVEKTLDIIKTKNSMIT